MNEPARIGDNSPPPYEAISLHIEDLFALVSDSTAAGKCTTDAQEAALDGLLDDMRQAKKTADAERATEKKPHADAAKAVDDKWRDVLKRCDAGMDHLKALLTPYREARQRAKDEAARKAREEAERATRAAQAALRKSDDLEERFAAEAELERAAKLEAAAKRIDRSATGLRTVWEAEITDRRAALNFYIKREPERFVALLQQLAGEDARGARGNVPGVTFVERKVAV